MIVFFNGQFVPEAQATVSIFDRSFLYGDGLFETIRISAGKPFRWGDHWQRLQAGAEFLRIRVPFTSDALRQSLAELIERTGRSDALLRITLSRGVGTRGYSPQSAQDPLLIMSLHDAPAVVPGKAKQWTLATSTLRINERDPLTRFKTANKLPQVLGRAEAESRGADEALFLDLSGALAESASGNVFLVGDQVVYTPPLERGALPGITRATVMELGRELGVRMVEQACTPDQVRAADGVFLTLTSYGLIEATALDGQPLTCSPLTSQLHRAYCDRLARETA